MHSAKKQIKTLMDDLSKSVANQAQGSFLFFFFFVKFKLSKVSLQFSGLTLS